jgi:type I restriction enzyme S subunit
MSADVLLANLYEVATSEGGPARIKQIIRDLAVRGKLAPQDSDDEPAGRLLERIGLEKNQLIEQKLVPKAKKLAPGASSEPAFEIPVCWAWTRIEEVTSYVQRGKSPVYVDSSTVPIVSQKCVQWSGFDLARARFVDESTLDSYGAERFLQLGDLLWNSTGTGTVGRINIFPGSSEFSTVVADGHVTVIRPLQISPQFLEIWLSSSHVQRKIEQLTSGTTNQQELNSSTIRRHLVPVPPLAEQLRIVARVESLFELCSQVAGYVEARKLALTRFAEGLEKSLARTS